MTGIARTMVGVGLVALTALLAGCSGTFSSAVRQEDQAKVQRLGVMSLLGDGFRGRAAATFSNTRLTEWDVADWQVDRRLAERTVAMLSVRKSFTAVALDRSSLKDSPFSREIDPAVWAAAQAQGVDHLLLFREGVNDNFRPIRPGYGLNEMSILGDMHKCVYLGYGVQLLDVQARKVVAWKWSWPRMCEMKDEDNDLSVRARRDDYSAQEQQQLKERLWRRMDLTLTHSLDELDLVPAAPAR